MVHGDDYCTTGEEEDLNWFEVGLSKEYTIKTQRIRPGGQTEGLILNRVLRVTSEGWELEADLRHSELIVEQLELENVGGLTVPGGTTKAEEEEDDDNDSELLSGTEATRFRAIGARCNYLAMDRPDIQYSVKEVCRLMSKPTKKSWERLLRVGRFLKSHARLVWKYVWQNEQGILDMHSDSNWAGCRPTRKSTSGGTGSLGTHYIKSWAKTQSTVAKSSGEQNCMQLLGRRRKGWDSARYCNNLVLMILKCGCMWTLAPLSEWSNVGV